MLRRMVPVAYLFVVLFGERTWANEFAFAAWPRSQIDEWAGGNSTGVSVCASLWVGRECYEVYHECEHQDVLLPKQDSYWVRLSTEKAGSKFLRLSRLRSCVPAYRWVNFGSFAKVCHGKSFYSGFLLFLEQHRAHNYYSLTKNQERTTLPSTTSDRQRARVKRKDVCKSKAWRNGASLKAHIASRWFPREIPVRGRFFERRFQALSVGGFFSNQRESISLCPKSPFPSKTQNRQIARTSPLSRVQGSQAYIWMQTVLFLWQRLFCAAPGRHLCTKIAAAPRISRGSRSDRGPRACAKTCLGDVAMVKKWRPRTSCTACSSKKTVGCQKLLRRSRKVCLWSSSWARITSPVYWQHVWTW